MKSKLKRLASKQRIKRQKLTSCRILVVCEGAKTEPLYFDKFKAIDNANFSYEIVTEGEGRNTLDLVQSAIRLRKNNQNPPFDVVWVVFDRDSFPEQNFDNAITYAKENEIEVAWSNEAFELWFLLHFNYRDTPMSRFEYNKRISDAVNSTKKWKDTHSKNSDRYKYKKNDELTYEVMSTYGNIDTAINNAERLHHSYKDNSYHNHNPCTTVYRLVRQLLNQDKELIAKVMDKINT